MGKKKTNKKKTDPLIFLEEDMPGILGLTPVDVWKMNPGPDFARYFDISVKKKMQIFPRAEGKLLCPGAAVGIDKEGIVQHIRPWNKIEGFLGFLQTNEDNGRCVVHARGAIVLAIPELKQADVKRKVYVSDVNTFSLDPPVMETDEGYEVGIVKGIEKEAEGDNPGRAVVLFKRFDATEPFGFNELGKLLSREGEVVQRVIHKGSEQ